MRLSIRGLAKTFGATRALDGVDLDLRAGSVHALIGENGAGKSTLLRILSGALAPDAGTLELEGRPFAPRSPREASRAGVRMVHQELALCPGLCVLDNLLLGEEPARSGFIQRRAAREQARAALEAVGRPGLPLEAPVASLPIAERQLVEIARALRGEPRVLILDEPTSSLPREELARLFALVRQLAARGVSVLYVSHALEEVRELCEHYTVLRDGQSVGSGAVADASEREWIAQMVGREVRELYPRSPRTRGERVLRGAGLELHRGEVLGLYGLIGAGRTELLRGLFGLDELAGAHALEFCGETGARTPRQRWNAGVGFVSEDRKSEGLALDLPVSENLALARMERFSRRGLIDHRALASSAATFAELLGVKCSSVAQRCGELSGGNQQKVALARLLQAGSHVLLLDEPTRGIDVGSKAQIYAWIDRLACGTQTSSPKAVLLVSSYLPELLGVCDRIAVMRRGELGPARPVAEWSEERLLEEALTPPVKKPARLVF
ncbi:MAG: sugar ABC transporter ATP-binding protein [Planctomycetes bacterium]|nr:sugar ABC transporter ATP-binding protein [Planctomycetota bacterium]